ncbi:MAG: HNH endonuclease [Roseibium sp.]|nr:HNH endonuclease [Roseibium sp.]
MVADLIRYEPESGKLFWKERNDGYFATTGRWQEWNRRHAGTEAFTAIDGDGYLHGTIRNQKFKAHRIAWVIHYGEWPKGQIDHLNGDRTDNRISNLRDVPNLVNQRNCVRRKDNTSGYTGVSFHRRSGKYRARVKIDGREIFLGNFDAADQAFLARVVYLYRNGLIGDARGFTARHGSIDKNTR